MSRVEKGEEPTRASRRISAEPVTVTETGAPSEDPSALIDLVRRAQKREPKSFGELAAGGMGTIDEVDDPVLGRRSARKRVHPHLQDDPDTLRRFIREAQVTGQLDHPNIVPVRQLAIDDQGQLYFTMKLVGGKTLSQILRELPRPLDHHSILEVLDIVLKVCDALSFAHSRHVIHCDIKPANIMVGEFGEVYLMDWGVALVLSETDPLLPPINRDKQETMLAGTPTHMAPEQASGQLDAIDARSDVFAVGALIYQALTEESPFYAGTFWACVLRAQMGAFTPIEEMVDNVAISKGLIAIVEKAMSKAPASRYSTVRELKEALVRFMRGGAPFPSTEFSAGTLIVREGDIGDTAYIIRSGRCVVKKGDTVLRHMGPGDVFGETAILSPGPRTASVIAEEDTVCQLINADVFERELDAMKPWMGAFIRTLADRFRQSGR